MPSTLRAVSLDLDNTLWDTPPVLARAEAAIDAWLKANTPRMAAAFDSGQFRALRLRLSRENPGRAHDVTWLRTASLREAAAATGYPASVAEAAFGVFWRERNAVELYEEVATALGRIAARVPVFALTNGNACVRQVGIGGYFRGAIDAAAAGAAKPDRQIFAHLVEMAGVAPGEILHVGDDAIADVLGAREAGLRSVWMNRIGAEWPAELPRAEYEIADLAALATLVESLTSR